MEEEIQNTKTSKMEEEQLPSIGELEVQRWNSTSTRTSVESPRSSKGGKGDITLTTFIFKAYRPPRGSRKLQILPVTDLKLPYLPPCTIKPMKMCGNLLVCETMFNRIETGEPIEVNIARDGDKYRIEFYLLDRCLHSENMIRTGSWRVTERLPALIAQKFKVVDEPSAYKLSFKNGMATLDTGYGSMGYWFDPCMIWVETKNQLSEAITAYVQMKHRGIDKRQQLAENFELYFIELKRALGSLQTVMKFQEVLKASAQAFRNEVKDSCVYLRILGRCVIFKDFDIILTLNRGSSKHYKPLEDLICWSLELLRLIELDSYHSSDIRLVASKLLELVDQFQNIKSLIFNLVKSYSSTLPYHQTLNCKHRSPKWPIHPKLCMMIYADIVNSFSVAVSKDLLSCNNNKMQFNGSMVLDTRTNKIAFMTKSFIRSVLTYKNTVVFSNLQGLFYSKTDSQYSNQSQLVLESGGVDLKHDPKRNGVAYFFTNAGSNSYKLRKIDLRPTEEGYQPQMDVLMIIPEAVQSPFFTVSKHYTAVLSCISNYPVERRECIKIFRTETLESTAQPTVFSEATSEQVLCTFDLAQAKSWLAYQFNHKGMAIEPLEASNSNFSIQPKMLAIYEPNQVIVGWQRSTSVNPSEQTSVLSLFDISSGNLLHSVACAKSNFYKCITIECKSLLLVDDEVYFVGKKTLIYSGSLKDVDTSHVSHHWTSRRLFSINSVDNRIKRTILYTL